MAPILRRVAGRLRRPTDLQPVLDTFLQHRDDLRPAFAGYFADMQSDASGGD